MRGDGRSRGAAPVGRVRIAALAAFLVVLVAAPVANAATFESSACPETPFEIPELENASCGYLVVPENRSEAGSPTIRLAVAIIPAQSPTPAPDPIVHMSGGPGVPAILEAPDLVKAGLNRERDLIIMNQRGQLFNEPELTCPEIDRFNARAVGLRSFSASTRRKHVKASRKCHDRFVAEGVDLAAYNTTESAADFADLRTALGLAEWNVYGSSYGTALALTYMREHPEGIRSVTIDGVLPPSVVSLGWTWSSAKQGIGNIWRACAAQDRCAKHFPDLRRTFTRLLRKLALDPIITRVKAPGGDERVKVLLDDGAVLAWLLSAAGFAPAGIPAAIDDLAHGDPRVIAEVRAAAAGPGADLFPLGYGLNYGVFCEEWVPFERRSAVLREGRRVFPNYPTSLLEEAPQLTFTTEDCRVWDVPKAPDSIREVTESAIPTLVLSGSFDGRTGARWGKYAAKTLPNSTTVTIPGVGHIVAPKSSCAAEVLASFLLTPTAPDTGCVAGLKPAPFTVGRR